MPNWSLVAFEMLPHGYCLSWQPRLLWLHAVSDLVTAIAYYSIPFTLVLFAWRRRDLEFRWIFVLFGVFIMACGATHVMSLWNLWVPDYLASGIVKAVTAVASVGTAIILYPLIPKALALPGPAQWQAVNDSLRREIGERRDAEAEVRRLNAELENRVSERTAELEATNRRLGEANEELRRRETKIRQNRELLQSIIDNSTAVIFVKDLEGRYLLINRVYAELFHVSQEALIGGTDYDVFPRERADAFRDLDRQVLAAGGPLQAEEQAPQDDGLHTYLSVKYPLYDSSGRPYAVCGIATDITERKQAEAERLAREAAESASRAKSEFFAAMSHELRTPLNAILGYAQILQRDAGLSERQAVGLNTIRQSGQHLLTLINDVLDLARIEARKLDLYLAPVGLSAFLPVVADIVRIKAEEKSLLFSYEAAPDLPRAVLADEKRLRQILLNLLSNAVKFTDRGQVGFRIGCMAGDAASVRLRFEVSDTGVGMTPEQLGRIFQPFEQVGDVQRRLAGSGLGLAISQQLVRLMGGRIEVESRAGQGSRFCFEIGLPLADAAIAAPARERLATGYRGARRKILIVDDVVGNRAVLADLLGGLGFVPSEACDGMQAIEMLGTAAPDLVLTDLVMPVMDGLTAIRRIRAWPERQGLPIIAVSASANREDQAMSLDAGADAFLSKPLDQDALLATIGDLLQLTWTYADPAAPPHGASEGAAATAIPPQEEIEALHRLALAGNMRAIRRQAAHLAGLDAAYRPFADTLDRLALAYQSKALLALVEEHLHSESRP